MMSFAFPRPTVAGLVCSGLKKFGCAMRRTISSATGEPFVEGLTGVRFIIQFATDHTGNVRFFEAVPTKISVSWKWGGRRSFTLANLPAQARITFCLSDEFYHAGGVFRCTAGMFRFGHDCPFFGAHGEWIIGERHITHAPFTTAPGCVWKHFKYLG